MIPTSCSSGSCTRIRWYSWAYERQTGEQVRGVWVNERLREAPKPAQVDNTWEVGEPIPYGLYETGDSAMPGLS